MYTTDNKYSSDSWLSCDTLQYAYTQLIIVTKFWEMDLSHTFIFDYISHYHMKSIIFSEVIFFVDFKTENIKEIFCKYNCII